MTTFRLSLCYCVYVSVLWQLYYFLPFECEGRVTEVRFLREMAACLYLGTVRFCALKC